MSAAICHADSTWTLACALLEYWCAHGTGVSARNGDDRVAYQRWSNHEKALRDEFERAIGGGGAIGDAMRGAIVERTGDGEDVHAVHAAGWALSGACAASFPSTWRGSLLGEEHQLAEGELFPVCDAPWPWLQDGSRAPTSRGPSLTNPPDDELPHVRRYSPPRVDGRPLDIVFDFRFEGQLRAVLDNARAAAGLHPNDHIDEFSLPGDPSFFPIAPADEELQAGRVASLAHAAIDAGATIVIAPELSVPDSALEALAAAIDDLDDDVLVVAGSRHHTENDVRVNDATALLPDQPLRLTHRKIVRFTSELGSGPGTREGIDRIDAPVARLYQAGPYRLAMPICKDLLDSSLTAALAHAGANVVLAPSMSPKSDGFLAPAMALLAANQALTVLVCGPLSWGADRPDPIALRVQPVASDARLERAAPRRGITRLPLG